jgi:hypothetical protein
MGYYLITASNREKEFLGSSYVASSSRFVIRFNYISKIDEETKNITWESDEVDFYVASFQSSSLY